MSLLLESIRIKDGALFNAHLHNERMNRSRRALFGCGDEIELRDKVRVPEEFCAGLVKCRVLYRTDVERVEFANYTKRTVRSLRIVRSDTIEYAHKYEDKSAIQALLALRDGCDDILIVKRGRITDTSFSNIAFFDGARWVTPAEPLLEGTMRAGLLAEGSLVEEEIRARDLARFQLARCINCMLDPGDIDISMERIIGGPICG
jgi:4-amino-4-deoxychorismate lyase